MCSVVNSVRFIRVNLCKKCNICQQKKYTYIDLNVYNLLLNSNWSCQDSKMLSSKLSVQKFLVSHCTTRCISYIIFR